MLNLAQGTSDASSAVCAQLAADAVETKEQKSEDSSSSTSDAKQCPLCSKSFGLLNRKHRCQRCGGLACAKCSKHKLANADGKAERACGKCYLAATSKSKADADASKSMIEVEFDLMSGDKLAVKVWDKSDASNAVQMVCTGSPYGTLDEAEMTRMARDAQQYQKEDAEMKETMAAREKLEDALLKLRDAEDSRLKHLGKEARQAVLNTAQAVEEWMDANVDARRLEYELKRQEIERMCDVVPSDDEQKHEEVNWKQQRVDAWLNQLGMEQYTPLFLEQGYDDMDVIAQTMRHEDLKEIGLEKRGHRAKIMLWIERFNAQQKDEGNGEAEGGETALF